MSNRYPGRNIRVAGLASQQGTLAQGDTPARYPLGRDPQGRDDGGDMPEQRRERGWYGGDRQDDRSPSNRWNNIGYCDIDAVQLLSTCNHIVVVPSIPLCPAGETVAGRVEFRTGGKRTRDCDTIHIIGMRGSVVDDTPGSQDAGPYELASMGLQIKTSQGLDWVTNGSNADFVKYSDLFQNSMQFFPLGIDLPTSEILHFLWQNTQPSATGDDLQASLAFFCRLPNA